MTQRRRAGEPGAPRRTAGSPRGAAGPPRGAAGAAGAPKADKRAKPRPDAGPGQRDTELGADEQRPTDAADQGSAPPAPKDPSPDQDSVAIAELRRERDEYLELAQRTKADFENYRRRAAREAGEAERRGKSGLARELVPVLDNLERALRAAQIDPEAEAADGDGAGLAHGVLLVYRDLRSAVERAGVETYDPAGERFDPTWHEALSTRLADGAEPGTVIETVEKGYRLGDQVLRPARVVVSE